MGVLACNRNGCENIMCARYSYEYGYICDECFEELVKSGVDTNIAEFMYLEKQPPYRRDAAEARFNVEFPLDK